MNIKQLATLKNAYDKRKELLEFQEHLKKNPIQESEYRHLVNGLNLNSQEKIKYFSNIDSLRKNKMIIDDIPEPYADFTKRVEAEGRIALKKSVMKQMSNEEFEKLTTKAFALYDDIKGDKVVHYRYRDSEGHIRNTGEGISVSIQDTNDIEAIKKAQNNYKYAKDEIGKILEEIDVNGNKYQDYKKPKLSDVSSPMERFANGKQI